VLGVTDIDPADDFFDLGGNSMLATRIHTRLQDAFGISLPLRAMFEATTVKAQGEVVADEVARDIASLPDERVRALAQSAPAPGVDDGETHSRRHAEFEVSLRIRQPGFISPSRSVHRGWMLDRTLDEFTDALYHLDAISREFAAGASRPAISAEWGTGQATYSDTQLVIGGQEVMQDWELPLMRALAGFAAEGGGDVLEIGFGMGLSAGLMQQHGIRSHTIIEANDQVAAHFRRWREQYPASRIELVPGRWQDVIGGLGTFDAILFDAYPTTEAEFRSDVVLSTTYAEPFFAAAAEHLRPGGVFSYYTNEIDSLGRRHQRLLLEHFRSFAAEIVTGLHPPADCTYWWANRMLAVKAVR
jgi:protein-L-isoaspartate O-methyltransferase/acyl carrier protein